MKLTYLVEGNLFYSVDLNVNLIQKHSHRHMQTLCSIKCLNTLWPWSCWQIKLITTATWLQCLILLVKWGRRYVCKEHKRLGRKVPAPGLVPDPWDYSTRLILVSSLLWLESSWHPQISLLYRSPRACLSDRSHVINQGWSVFALIRPWMLICHDVDFWRMLSI